MFDLVIRGGLVIDGSGNVSYNADVGVSDGRIAAVGQLDMSAAGDVYDAAGRVVCPGFIDTHSHSDVMMLSNPKHEPKIMQGVTTDVLGLDGLSYAPLSPDNLALMRRYLSGLNGNPDIGWDWSSVGEYLSLFDRRVAVNAAYLVPHCALRLETVGFVDRAATDGELKRMQRMVEQAMDEGAVGFSTGLDYFPCRYGCERELDAICEAVARCGGVSVWHVRKRDLGLVPAIMEVIGVAERTGVRVHLSHYGTAGPDNEGRAPELLAIVDDARDRGLKVTFDSYPYPASSTSLIIVLPRWVHEGGPDRIGARLAEPGTRARICAELEAAGIAWDRMRLSLLSLPENRPYVGLSLADGAAAAGQDVPGFVCDLLLTEDLAVGYVGFDGHEQDIREIVRHGCHTVCSDGILVGDRPNPRGWGAFARFLGVYSRDLGLLRLEEAVRHMTSLPADVLGLKGRGLLRTGYAADLVVFDPKTIQDTATFDDPRRHPVGIDLVCVNGVVAVRQGLHTGALNGTALTR